MNAINRLGLTVVIITIVVLAVAFGGWWAVQKYWLEPRATQEQVDLSGESGDVSQDTDGDGLPDLVENLYKTDPANADTDGDTVNDGDEVRAGRNPTLAEPAGALGNLPLGKNVTEQNTWTQKYLASLPEDTPQDQVLDQARLSAFVNVNKGQLLPTLPAGLVKTSAATGKEAVKAYLDKISPAQNSQLHHISNQDIEAAWRAAYQNSQPATLQDLIQKLHANVDTLQAVEAPKELEALHTKVVAAAHSLTNNSELLRDMNQDFVGGLIGAKNIEDLGAVFQEIQTEIAALDTKYGFE